MNDSRLTRTMANGSLAFAVFYTMRWLETIFGN